MKDVHELEVYSPIEGFPDYLVTSHGRVLSLKYGKLKEIKEVDYGLGYLYVLLCKNGKRYNKRVHRLVAQAFIPNPENKPQVNHIDENKANNHVSNLEWMTIKENCNHGTRNERVSKTMSDGRLKGKNSPMYGKKHSEETKHKMSESHKVKYIGNKNPCAKSIIGFKINGCNIKYYKHISDCKKDGFDKSTIIKCCKGKLKTSKGYKWFYADEFFNKNKNF